MNLAELNKVAEAMVAPGRGILAADDFLRSIGGRLVARDGQTDRSLREIFADAGDAEIGIKGIALPFTAHDGERHVAHVLPLTSGARRSAGNTYMASAAVFVRKAEMETRSPPEVIAKTPRSHTGHFLKDLLERRPRKQREAAE